MLRPNIAASVCLLIFPGAGAHCETLHRSISDRGAKCDGNGSNAPADTAAIVAAAEAGEDIYIPRNTYCILLAPVVLKRTGQRILGDGPQASRLLIYSSFGADRSGTYLQGVINLEAPAQEVRDLGLSFQQPRQRPDHQPLKRSDLMTYQPAIRAHQPATVLNNIMIAGATTCIDMGADTNAGNSYLHAVEVGCYDYGLRLDGSFDTVHIDALHAFPFEMNAAQRAVFSRGENIAIDLGRVDDFAISNSLCFEITCLNFYRGKQGGAFGSVTGFDFDSAANGIMMTASEASVVVSASEFTSAESQRAIVQSAGKITISGSSFFMAAPTEAVLFTGGVMNVSGSSWNQLNNDSTFINTNCKQDSNIQGVGLKATRCRLVLNGNLIERDVSTTFKAPWLRSQGEESIVGAGNSATATEKAGIFVSFAKDAAGNRWVGNSSPGSRSLLGERTLPNGPGPRGGFYFAN